MPEPRTLEDLQTPAPVVDLDRLEANLDRMAGYTAAHGLGLRPHTKTHKAPWLAAEQLRRGAGGVTVATLAEAEAMAEAADDILLAYPPVGATKLRRLLALPERVRLTVALDSGDALRPLAAAAREARREVGVLVELDAGMARVGVGRAEDACALAGEAAAAGGIAYRGVLFYPGHIRQHVDEQEPAIERLAQTLESFLEPLVRAGLAPEVVSGGSTPAAFAMHRVPGITEVRPGTYVYNDRTTAVLGACAWDHIAYSVLATVVSTAVAGQAVVDAGSKALATEAIRGADSPGLGALLDRPEVFVRSTSEEHGLLDLSGTDWRPRVGDLVRVVPNHVCVSVNLHSRIHGLRGDGIERTWDVRGRH